MNSISSNYKIYLGSAYLLVLSTVIYFVLSNFGLSDLTSYELIKENRSIILKYKENNIFFLIIIFLIIIIFLNLLLAPMLIPTLIIGFIFGKWLGTLILVLGSTSGALLLYLIVKTFFSKLIKKILGKKIDKFLKFFKKNEVMYFMLFRFIGGGGTPFPIQNILPIFFNMTVKNYIISTFLGIIPATFVTAALGSGIEDIISQNTELSFMTILLSPEIYFPIVGFAVILIFALVIKKYYFKQ
jgi:uncharacterized membrane protein YdjX (TVP38/TMEM64 family)